MNERIKELHMQAQQEAFNEPIDIENCAVADIKGFSQQVYEKFAELIVRECMAQCTKVEEDDELCGVSDGALLCREEIKEHFGVEK